MKRAVILATGLAACAFVGLTVIGAMVEDSLRPGAAALPPAVLHALPQVALDALPLAMVAPPKPVPIDVLLAPPLPRPGASVGAPIPIPGRQPRP